MSTLNYVEASVKVTGKSAIKSAVVTIGTGIVAPHLTAASTLINSFDALDNIASVDGLTDKAEMLGVDVEKIKEMNNTKDKLDELKEKVEDAKKIHEEKVSIDKKDEEKRLEEKQQNRR
ncbi:MAG: hypothetical protein U9N59_10480 [Campylobacterota bacterium]|nr:hypothetical protein [Campylobacterota bacterium]